MYPFDFKVNNLFPNQPPVRNFYPQLTAKKWRPIAKELKKLPKLPSENLPQLLEIIARYTELFNIVEDRSLLVGSDYLCNGTPKSIFGIVKYVLKVTAWAFLQRKKFIKFLYTHPLFPELEKDHIQLVRLIKKETELKGSLFLAIREYWNVMLYTNKVGKLTVMFDGEKYTVHKLSRNLSSPDRVLRERSWIAIQECVQNAATGFNSLFDKMRKAREKKAVKNGFANARDYYHLAKGRFDYTPQDCEAFHHAIETLVVPYLKDLTIKRQEKLQLDSVRPWDTAVPLSNPLKPFDTPEFQAYTPDPTSPYSKESDYLLTKLIEIFSEIHPSFGATLQYMKDHQFLDIENKKGKIPGAMSIPLADHRAAFIIANNVGSHSDIITTAHEGGHAVHWSYATAIPNAFYRELMLFPMEIAEVGSMTMEFLILPFLDRFYSDPALQQRARKEALNKALSFLPWCAIVDAFQHWVYTHPEQSVAQRDAFFSDLVQRFYGEMGVDYSGLEQYIPHMWYRQSHIFSSPFYYIEYGISQLAALSIYRNYIHDPKTAVAQYIEFMKAGNSLPIKEVYQKAGIRFDFSSEYLAELMDFIKGELAE